MFSECKNLINITLSNFNIQNDINDMRYIYTGCNTLTNIDLSNFYT